jgi:hypothetical protein
LDIQQTDDALCTALTVFASDNEAKVMLQYYWLGHMSFDTMSKIFPEELKNMDKGKNLCVMLVSMESTQGRLSNIVVDSGAHRLLC